MKTLKTILTIFFLIGLFFTVYKTLEYFKLRGEKLRQFGGVTSLNITGHVMSTGTPPTLIAGGTGYQTTSVQAGSTDFKGSFTGVVPSGEGQLQVKFVTAYTYAPVCLASIASAQPTTTFYVTSSVSEMALNFIAGNVSGTKSFNYTCIQ